MCNTENTDLNITLKTTKEKLKRVYAMIGNIDKPKHLMQSIQRKNAAIVWWRTEAFRLRKSVKKSSNSCEKTNKQASTLTK